MRFGNFHMRSVVVSFHPMSTPALALTVPRVPRRLRRRRHALNRFPVQWHGAAVAEAVALTGGKSPKRSLALVLAAVAVLAAHALGVWYGNNVSIATDARPKKSTLALEFVRPPKPLPKVEPPPPPPPKVRPKAPPPIQTAAVVAERRAGRSARRNRRCRGAGRACASATGTGEAGVRRHRLQEQSAA